MDLKYCFAIYKTSGYMDDYHQYVHAFTFDEDKAKQFVETYNEKLRKLKDRILELYPNDEYGYKNDDLYNDELLQSGKIHWWYTNVLNQNDAYYCKVNFL